MLAGLPRNAHPDLIGAHPGVDVMGHARSRLQHLRLIVDSLHFIDRVGRIDCAAHRVIANKPSRRPRVGRLTCGKTFSGRRHSPGLSCKCDRASSSAVSNLAKQARKFTAMPEDKFEALVERHGEAVSSIS
jgi:hypothetical protein